MRGACFKEKSHLRRGDRGVDHGLAPVRESLPAQTPLSPLVKGGTVNGHCIGVDHRQAQPGCVASAGASPPDRPADARQTLPNRRPPDGQPHPFAGGTHSLAGAALGEAGLKRRAGLGLAALIIGANLPDVDVIAIPFRESLAFRRGWTHGPLAVLVLPVLLTLALVGWVRLQTRRGRRPAGRSTNLHER
jgi:hypothetical protein